MFATTGRLPADSDAWQPMFCALQKTAFGIKHRSITGAMTTSRPLVSTQFGRVVRLTQPNDNFLRPCQWVVWSRATDSGLIVAPEEADQLIPILRGDDPSSLPTGKVHLIIYSAPVTRRMLQFNNLDFFAIPTLPQGFEVPLWLKVELGIFSGRLYFDWDELSTLLAYLGVEQTTNSDGNERDGARPAFAKNSLIYLHEWLAVRRKGQDFEYTPMGFVTTRKPLTANHPFFNTSSYDTSGSNARLEMGTAQLEEHVDSDDDEDEDVFYDANDTDHVHPVDNVEDDVKDSAFFDSMLAEEVKSDEEA